MGQPWGTGSDEVRSQQTTAFQPGQMAKDAVRQVATQLQQLAQTLLVDGLEHYDTQYLNRWNLSDHQIVQNDGENKTILIPLLPRGDKFRDACPFVPVGEGDLGFFPGKLRFSEDSNARPGGPIEWPYLDYPGAMDLMRALPPGGYANVHLQ
ncbi:hypothetical protein BBP40_003105 [Aspergillus hancockii]|nr:hypothetical protein BBP40_003105 [Aspergillus hancockii]